MNNKIANTKKLRELCPIFYEFILNVGGSKSDWFIPSMNELVLMLTNTNFVWRDKFGLNALWTSTEENSTYAEYRSPNVPEQLASVEKSNQALFVPIRFFG